VNLRNITRTQVLTCAAALIVSTGLAACGSSSTTATADTSGSSPAKKFTVGFSPYNQSAPALVGLAKGVKDYAQSKGASTLIADPNNDPTKQAQQIRSWIELGQVNAVWVLALNPTAIKALIPLAQSKGVGLLATGTPADYGKSAPDAGLSYSIIDYAAYGKAIGGALADCANERLGGNAKALFAANPAGSTGKAQEDAAIKEALTAGAPNSTIVSTIDNKNDRLESQKATLTAIQANQDLNAVIGVSDESTMGPMTAFTQARKDLSKSCLVGAGGSDEALAAVKAGKLYADVAIQFSDDMTQSVDELVRFSQDAKAAGKQLFTPFKTVKK
jgi:ABC-type sugar transport system substrate-binding protein